MYMLGTNALNIVLHIESYTRLRFLCSSKANQISDFVLTILGWLPVIKSISLDISNKIRLYLLALFFF